MQNPSNGTRRAQERNSFSTPILPSTSAFPQYPALPEHLDKLLDQPWTPEASKLIDLWLQYAALEFEVGGGNERHLHQ